MDESPYPDFLREIIYRPLQNNVTGEPCDLTSEIYNLAENLVSPDIEARREGFSRLASLNVIEQSPLLVYILATRITEPDIELRSEIVKTIGDLLLHPSKDGNEFRPVIVLLRDYLVQMRTRQIYSLLQVADFEPIVQLQVFELLKSCSFASNHLCEILLNRRAPIGIRKLAAQYIGEIGYLDSIATLERVETRLISRFTSQQPSPEINLQEEDEAGLLPVVRNALSLLRAP